MPKRYITRGSWLPLVDVFRNRKVELEVTFSEVKRVFEMLGGVRPVFV